jgi:hypothetical protein
MNKSSLTKCYIAIKLIQRGNKRARWNEMLQVRAGVCFIVGWINELAAL